MSPKPVALAQEQLHQLIDLTGGVELALSNDNAVEPRLFEMFVLLNSSTDSDMQKPDSFTNDVHNSGQTVVLAGHSDCDSNAQSSDPLGTVYATMVTIW